MAIKIRLPNGITAEAETEAELRLILSVVGSNGVATESPTTAPKLAAGETFEERLGRLPNLLRSDAQLRALQHLVANPLGLSDEALRGLAGVASNRELAGVLAGLTKSIVKLGLDPNAVFIRRINKHPDGRRWYRYALTPVAIEVLLQPVSEMEAPPLSEVEAPPPEDDIPF